jgi:hypothetical protein
MDAGFVVWVTGADDGAVLRVADAITSHLAQRHVATEQLDPRLPGIEVLAGPTLAERVAFAAALLARHGVAVVVAVPSPSRAERDAARARVPRMIEVWVPGAERAGYEVPDRPEVEAGEPEATAERTLHTLEVLGHLARGNDPAYSEEEERQVIKRLKSFGYL